MNNQNSVVNIEAMNKINANIIPNDPNKLLLLIYLDSNDSINIIEIITNPMVATKSQGITSSNVNEYISVARVVPPSSVQSPKLPLDTVPNTITIAADSPIILPIANIIPDIICGIAIGSEILNDDVVFVEPKANDPLIALLGTELIASEVVWITVGTTINVSISAPASGANPIVVANGKNNAAPTSPNINEGIPVSISTPVSNTLVVLLSLAKVEKYIPVPIPKGNINAIDNKMVSMVPNIAVCSPLTVISVPVDPLTTSNLPEVVIYPQLRVGSPCTIRNINIDTKNNSPTIAVNQVATPNVFDVLAFCFSLLVVIVVLFIVSCFLNSLW